MTRGLGTFGKGSRAVHTVVEPDLSDRQQELETNHREARDRVDIGQVARRMVALRRAKLRALARSSAATLSACT
jgi:hypothetical protein